MAIILSFGNTAIIDYNILNKEVGTMEQTHPLRRMLNEK